MDPVALQFLQELDAAAGEGELPSSVMSGLVMCGDDALPGLLERLDPERPTHQQRHAAQALGRIQADEALVPLIHAFASAPPDPSITRAIGSAIRAYGAAAHPVILEGASREAYLPAGRLTLVGMVVTAGGEDPRIDDLVAELAPKAPRVGLLLMKERPRARWIEVIRDHRDVFRVTEPGLMAEVSLLCLPLAQATRAEHMEALEKVLSKQEAYAAEVMARMKKKTDDA